MSEQIFENYESAHAHSLTVPWKLETCNSGESCWCRIIVPIEKILYKNRPNDEVIQEIDYIIPDGSIDKETAEYFLELHHDKIKFMNKQEPMAWAVMQPDSYKVFVLYNQAVAHREDCAGGDIVPLYKQQENQIQSMLDAIRSAEVDTLELPEITDKNKSNVKPQKLPKRNETNT